MGNLQKKYCFTTLIGLQRCIMVIVCLVLLAAMKPIFSVLLDSNKAKYELCDDYEEKDLDEKESQEENKEESKEEKKEEKKEIFLNSCSNSEQLVCINNSQSSTRIYIELYQYANELYIDILSPPPRKA